MLPNTTYQLIGFYLRQCQEFGETIRMSLSRQLKLSNDDIEPGSRHVLAELQNTPLQTLERVT